MTTMLLSGLTNFSLVRRFEDDAKQLRLLADKHEGDPFYRYGLQQTGTKYDPSAIEEDLGATL